MTKSNYKLTKEDFTQINKRSLFTYQLGWNYERMQGSGYLYIILPQLRKMYGDGTPELKEMMKLHTQFFNTSNFFHTIITGIDLALEETDGVESKDAVNGIKTGLMGPFAPIGDSIFGSLVPAIMGSIAATLAIQGQPWGVLLWVAVTVAIKAPTMNTPITEAASTNAVNLSRMVVTNLTPSLYANSNCFQRKTLIATVTATHNKTPHG